MAHARRNAKFLYRSKRANHGKMGARGTEKSRFRRFRRRKDKIAP